MKCYLLLLLPILAMAESAQEYIPHQTRDVRSFSTPESEIEYYLKKLPDYETIPLPDAVLHPGGGGCISRISVSEVKKTFYYRLNWTEKDKTILRDGFRNAMLPKAPGNIEPEQKKIITPSKQELIKQAKSVEEELNRIRKQISDLETQRSKKSAEPMPPSPIPDTPGVPVDPGMMLDIDALLREIDTMR